VVVRVVVAWVMERVWVGVALVALGRVGGRVTSGRVVGVAALVMAGEAWGLVVEVTGLQAP
jgi:hypothetical protein